MIRLLRIVAMALLLGAGGAMAQMPIVAGEPALAPKDAAPAPKLRIAQRAQPDVVLSPITDSELASVLRANDESASLKRVAIGVVRKIASTVPLPSARELAWQRVAGGYAAQAALSSPEAGALRLAIDLAGVPEDVEMVFFGSGAPDRIEGPIRVASIKDRSTPWWSPVTDGDTQTVEFFVPSRHDAAALPLRLTGASHLLTTLASGLRKRVQDMGSAGACTVDVKCSSLQSAPGFLNTRSAVAEMVFNDGSTLFLCSGTLLNDTDSSTQIPWFYSANHCFDNESPPFKTDAQIQAVANTLNTLWFFEAVSCNNHTTVPSYAQLSSGATLIYHNGQADVLFLRLNDPAPNGAFFAGWDANTLSTGGAAVSIHHPQGDLKKVSQGTIQGFSSQFAASSSPGSYIQFLYNLGVDEPGSSGAGIFTTDGAQYYLRGGLYGGPAACSGSNVNGQPDYYSRLDQVYASLAAYLSPVATPNADYTDLWWNPSESGWGLNIEQHASGIVFVIWYTYGADNKETWYTISSGTWTSANTYTGTITYTTGPRLPSLFDPTGVARRPAGTGTLTFSDANNGTWSFSVDGVSGSRPITRLGF
jgi:lysyl endopeptidase